LACIALAFCCFACLVLSCTGQRRTKVRGVFILTCVGLCCLALSYIGTNRAQGESPMWAAISLAVQKRPILVTPRILCCLLLMSCFCLYFNFVLSSSLSLPFSCLVLSCPVLSCFRLALSRLILSSSRNVLFCFVLSFWFCPVFVLSCVVLCCDVSFLDLCCVELSCFVMRCLVMCCVVFSCLVLCRVVLSLLSSLV
jgi:hypothetical protein